MSGGDASDWAQGNARAEQSYVVFDVLQAAGNDLTSMPWHVRRQAVETIVNSLKWPRVRASTVLGNPAHELMEEVEKRGAEGIMLKRREGLYEIAKRSKGWLKSKVTFTVDVAAIDMAGKPTAKDRIDAGWKNIRYGFVIDGRLQVVGQLGVTGLPHELEQFVGKVAEVKVYGVSPTGGLRHPVVMRWRDDKLPEECLLTDAVNRNRAA